MIEKELIGKVNATSCNNAKLEKTQFHD